VIDKELAMLAVGKNVNNIKFIPAGVIDRELAMLAVGKHQNYIKIILA
jgi:hypothetical protein